MGSVRSELNGFGTLAGALLLILTGCGAEQSAPTGLCAVGEARTGYPSGPFGTRVGALLADHTFADSEGNDFSLSGLHQDGDARVILLSTGAGWCTACIEEQPQLEQWAQTYGEDGLRVVMTVFEDSIATPATVEYARLWKEEHGLTFPVLVDAAGHFGS